MDPITNVLQLTNWAMLASQKLALLETITREEQSGDAAREKRAEHLQGILHWIDMLQDAAAEAGYPVVWLGENP